MDFVGKKKTQKESLKGFDNGNLRNCITSLFPFLNKYKSEVWTIFTVQVENFPRKTFLFIKLFFFFFPFRIDSLGKNIRLSLFAINNLINVFLINRKKGKIISESSNEKSFMKNLFEDKITERESFRKIYNQIRLGYYLIKTPSVTRLSSFFFFLFYYFIFVVMWFIPII